MTAWIGCTQASRLVFAEEEMMTNALSTVSVELPKAGLLQLMLPSNLMSQVDSYLGDVITLYGNSAGAAREFPASYAVKVAYDPEPDSHSLREMEPGVWARPGALLDRSYKTRISRSDDAGICIDGPTSSIEWMLWAVQLQMMSADMTFVHCAGVESNGESILFPSWGGVGKTAIAKGFVQDEGWKLLGDDLVLLSNSGETYAFPKPMVLYPYHRHVFPNVFEAGEGPAAPVAVNRLLTHFGPLVKPVLRKMPTALAWARNHNPQSVRIPPSKVFGSSAISMKSKAKAVVWMDRDASISEPVLRSADHLLTSRIAGSTMSEFDRHCVSLTPMLCGLGIVSFADTYAAWTRILDQGLRDAQKLMLLIPAELPVAEVPDVVKSSLASVGLLEGN